MEYFVLSRGKLRGSSPRQPTIRRQLWFVILDSRLSFRGIFLTGIPSPSSSCMLHRKQVTYSLACLHYFPSSPVPATGAAVCIKHWLSNMRMGNDVSFRQTLRPYFDRDQSHFLQNKRQGLKKLFQNFGKQLQLPTALNIQSRRRMPL